MNKIRVLTGHRAYAIRIFTYAKRIMATTLKSADTFDMELLLQPAAGAGPQPMVFRHPEVGNIRIRNFAFPHMHAMNMDWETEDDIVLKEPEPSEAININFQVRGHMYSEFRGLQQAMDMNSTRHNLVFTREAGATHYMKAGQSLRMFHLSLDREFFMSLIGTDDPWSEHTVSELQKERPVAGRHGNLEITHRMQALISNINTCTAPAPVHNLLVQSRLFELIALQVEQFRAPFLQPGESLKKEDADKLYLLKQYLDNHYLQEHSLTELSRISLLNEFKLKKGFRELFGTSIFNYLRQLRMEYASNRLRNTTDTIDEIAFDLGYEHAQHFSAAFKKFYHCTPSQMRA